MNDISFNGTFPFALPIGNSFSPTLSREPSTQMGRIQVPSPQIAPFTDPRSTQTANNNQQQQRRKRTGTGTPKGRNTR
jgi:hypothetical protein